MLIIMATTVHKWMHLTRGYLTFTELSTGEYSTRPPEWQFVMDISFRPEGERLEWLSGQTPLHCQQRSAAFSGPDRGQQEKENTATRLAGELGSFSPSLCQGDRIGRNRTNRKLILSQVWPPWQWGRFHSQSYFKWWQQEVGLRLFNCVANNSKAG